MPMNSKGIGHQLVADLGRVVDGYSLVITKESDKKGNRYKLIGSDYDPTKEEREQWYHGNEPLYERPPMKPKVESGEVPKEKKPSRRRENAQRREEP